LNELTVKTAGLPALATEEVKQCVDLIGDAIQALKSKRNAAGHIGASKDVIDEMDAQIREYSAMKLKAEIELGKRTATMERNTDFHGNQHSGDVNTDYNTKKGEQLAEIGVTRQQASVFERMAKHETYVDQYIGRKLALGQTPTRHEVMREIQRAERPDTPTEAAKRTIRAIKDAKVIDIDAADALKESQNIIETEVAEKVYKELADALKCLLVYSEYADEDMIAVSKFIDSERLEPLKRSLNNVSGYAFRISQKIGG